VWLDWGDVDLQQGERWALQVQTEGDAFVLGMRSFSARPVRSGRVLDEWLYAKELGRAGVLAPRHAFVNVHVNGREWGIYALKEALTEAWLTSQGRSDGLVVHLSDSVFWRARAPYGSIEDGHWSLYTRSAEKTDLPAYAQVDEWNVQVRGADGVLSKQAVTALGLLRAFHEGQLAASLVFDAERLGRYVAHANLWGARQAEGGSKERYYYHPLTSRLEPIGSEAFVFTSRDVYLSDLGRYDDPEVMRAYAQEVARISRPEYLDELRARYDEDVDRIHAALAQALPPSDIELPWSTLAQRQVRLLSALQPRQAAHAYLTSPCPAGKAGLTLDLHVANLLPYPIVLQQLRIGEGRIDLQAEWATEKDVDLLDGSVAGPVVLRGASGITPRYVALRVPAGAFAGQALSSCDALELVTSIVGVDRAIAVGVEQDYPPALSSPAILPPSSVADALERHAFLERSDLPGFLEVKPGTWAVDGDLVLPAGLGLRATRPVTLTFDPGAILYATGPVLMQAVGSEGIYLLPKAGTWGGVVVLQADPRLASSLANVEVRGVSGIRRGGWVTTGGITLYESPAVLRDCRVADSSAPAALHVVRAPFRLSGIAFSNATGDALRSDYAEGRVEQSAFSDVLGNAIDVSGSQVDVDSVTLNRVYDRGIAADKGSVVTVQRLRALEVGMAIASADRAYVYARDVTISQARVAGLAAYAGRAEYGPASIQASQVVFGEDESLHALAERDSSVTLNGYPVVTRQVDVDALHWRTEALSVTHVLNYRLGPTMRLIGYGLPKTEVTAGDSLELTLYWYAVARPPLDYTVFVHVLDASGQNVAGWDAMPRGNTFPTGSWPVGRGLDDLYQVPLPADLATGVYRVAVGLYYYPTGDRVPIYGPDGAEIPEARVLLDQEIEVR
jgi:hypothetical protein